MLTQMDVFHATTVCLGGKGIFIVGPSGAGKSGLALELMSLGATLVADDRTKVVRHGPKLRASVPETIQGLIEARGIGILTVPYRDFTDLALVIDLGKVASERLPEPARYLVLGVSLPCIQKVEASHFAASIFWYVKGQFKKAP